MQKTPDDLTVLVFKDNAVARTFNVPLNWVSRLGLIAGSVAAVAILGIFLTTRFFILSHQLAKAGNPIYLQELEQENSSLKTSLKQAQAAAIALTANSAATASPKTAALSNVGPIPTVTVTATPTQTLASTASAITPVAPPATPVSNAVAGPGFSALPSSITTDLTNPSISIYEPKAEWIGKSLHAQFFIQYTREDKGNQQGRIILLARGPETVMSYPADLLNSSDQPSLINPKKGEYFSVSRIREVKAEFSGHSSSTFNEVEVYLISEEGKLLVHQSLKVEAAAAPTPKHPAKAEPKAAPKAASEDTSPSADSTAEPESDTNKADVTPSPPVNAAPITPATQEAPGGMYK